MEYTVTIKDTILTELIAALTAINQRLPASQRVSEPLTIKDSTIQEIVTTWVITQILTDLSQEVQETAQVAATQKANDLRESLSATPIP